MAQDWLSFERPLWSAGIRNIAGIDEVGRGCLAGPVVAAAVIFPPNCCIPGVDDSKRLSPTVREALYPIICEAAIAYGVGIVGAEEIDVINILQAARKAMGLAVSQLAVQPEHLFIDGRDGIEQPLPQSPIVQGDRRSHSIAAASIIAKVTRDRMMVEYESLYPTFRFGKHKGYGTEQHLEELKQFGVTPIHRRSFAPCRDTGKPHR